MRASSTNHDEDRMRPSTSGVPEGVEALLREASPPSRRPMPRVRLLLRILARWSLRIAAVLFGLSVLGALVAWRLVRHYEAGLPSVTELEHGYRPSQVTRVLARDGTPLAELFTERRTLVRVEDLPRHVTLAFIAAEDASFYEHEGINYLGIARAAIVNLRSGRTRQGGSTITQQVVKNILLESSERTYARKMREALLARRLEQELCPECGTDRAGRDRRKDKILELYLNHIYLGHGRYGIEEAALDSFGKSAKRLTLSEAAILAGVPAAPELYNPRRDLNRALSRRAFVLEQMRAKHFITEAQYETAKAEPVQLSTTRDVEPDLAPEAVQIAKKLLLELEPERGPKGGFTITTTIDPGLQQASRKALRENLRAYDKRHHLQAPYRAALSPKRGHAKSDSPLFEGTPDFKAHKILNGVVVGADDTAGTLDVRVGTITGTLKIADYTRYNPEGLPPSKFAEVGAHLRVSLLAPVSPSSPASPASPASTISTEGAGGAPVALPKVPLRLEQGPESALVVLDVRTRHILALAGSYEAQSGALDRATQSRRQPGSTFKPIVYSYALHSRRYTPATLVEVLPRAYEGGYAPTNYEGWTSSDPLRLREALANSVNIAAVNVLEDVGAANVVDWAKALGIASTLKPTPSLALGAYEVRPLELAGAYATFAAGGVFEESRLVQRIVDAEGKEVALPPLPPPRRVLEPAEAYLITNMLESVIDHGTGQRAKVLGRRVAGKTGTSNESRDAWFSGFSPEIAGVVWVGYDDAKPLGTGEAGGTAALPAWIQVMDAAHRGKPRSEFSRPSGLVSVVIDPKTGTRNPEGGDGGGLEELFLEGTEPQNAAEVPAVGDAAAGSDGDGGLTSP
jgi:penicillin-binding protein 1A